MAPMHSAPPVTHVERLAWDSAEFGFGVGKLTVSDVVPPNEVLARDHYDALVAARSAGLRLVYLQCPALTPHALAHLVEAANLSGVHTDDRVTCEKRLTGSPSSPIPQAVRLRSYPVGPPSLALVSLGLQAGTLSRFRLDPRFPEPAFVRLYSEWTRRSTLREVCSDVLVAEPYPSANPELLGFVTVATNGGAASVGLVAVDSSARGHGVGAALMSGAETAAYEAGCPTIRVVTQHSNEAARRLYLRAGYAIVQRSFVYHLWLT